MRLFNFFCLVEQNVETILHRIYVEINGEYNGIHITELVLKVIFKL